MAAMLMVLVYNLADTFFIGQTHDALQVAAVSLATPVFLIFMAAGTVFGVGGTSVISRALGEGKEDYAKKVCSFCMWSCVIAGAAIATVIGNVIGAGYYICYFLRGKSGLSIRSKDFLIKFVWQDNSLKAHF